MSRLTSYLRRRALLPSKKKFDRWRDLKTRASGMLRPATYQELYETAFNGPDLDMIEIGGAAGAGGIALALGLKESGKRSRVVVCEPCEGGSRSRYGDRAANLAIITGNFRSFGVEAHVKLFPHRVTPKRGDEVRAALTTKQIGALLIDADGEIDRDIALFGPLLAPGGKIIIDDYRDDNRKFQVPNAKFYDGGIKLVRVFRLVNYMLGLGLLSVEKQIGCTLFCKLEGDVSLLNRADCAKITDDVIRYRDEVIAQRGMST